MDTKRVTTFPEEIIPRKGSKHSLMLNTKYASMKHGLFFKNIKRTPTSRPEVRIYGAKFNKRGKMTVPKLYV